MMALSIAPPSGPSPTTSTTSPPASKSSQHRDPSPEPPPASPLTPVARPAKPATQRQPDQPAHFIQQPPSRPFSADDSTDAIALRAAISSLQFQRRQAQRDLRALDDIKRLAVEHPQEYQQHVVATARAKPSPPPWATSSPSLSQDQDQDVDHDAVAGAPSLSADDSSSSESAPDTFPVSYGSMLHPQPTAKPQEPLKFPVAPKPQDVVRCPPIEWAKYNIVGESLDKLHRDQQLRPGDASSSQRDSVIAAPYNPFLDQLDPQSSQSPTAARKDSGSSAPGQTAQRRKSSKAAF